MNQLDHLYMRRALELAEWGSGNVSPNPMVGCVIVRDEKIIGEGYHQNFGEPHAEVNAVNSVENQEFLREATVYVTLEPCAHWGKTPPCANLLVEKQVKKVVIAAVDTNPLVGGKGIEILKNAGIEVETGVLEKEARWQNRRFFTQIEKNRPYVILKWAQTQDGFVARENFSSKWISGSQSRQLVHKWRAEEDAILVGKNTALHDNPSLNVRDWAGKNPMRIVLDAKLELSQNLTLFDQTIPTVCYNSKKSEIQENLNFVNLGDQFGMHDILKDLHSRKIQSLIVEGGTKVLSQFIENSLWDEARIFTGKVKFGTGISAPILNQNPAETLSIGEDILNIYHHG
ncbi:MAG: bifunctional diaminohydroxyphosphoribosylaminopyrimidine deaminase/5-amino-6-(5-phosphoribosylamino)uracil reductase RibD [Algoriphagus sp.]|uniref:bifunctional diaminohydroxyphosphoribosylaminopyrimidine deaminase/5-amino-6-(5-phosphoribosylamino)uracil reductase RibD n=1 Tax=Algoriphagus sp. TaxID=1872435 RepID=UPI0027305ED4|nr:bifunctional diaminohydroxyphosphoribosylaminopyrimidine deaminase/5-amino-6-(5-phosphoribosylamino)uracil reductase RibD [Algoriphagus sp.]MDP2040543.1 bifunctional diaminohydroxyphosphoribosylaminopyrimidine deaminase/5-amino-6-(5-phosphoribosylamino)uracil reductase RibD [Algoriphagus sp.]MDP3473293.1 bifunctional diaminohydroxyphosphoribosylaminopyrimidine deaminase/5-amino-6-(5-phosphoribosylamino)uracil reductase RibD [Algoriphagus sp.]